MTDAEFLFRSHEKETKRIARGSYNKKRRSKSRKCSLPHDNMTKKEWKRMNGEVVTYNTAKKMLWEEFIKMPVDLQGSYLRLLRDVHKGRQQDVADMFGVGRQTLANYVWRNKIACKFKHGTANPNQAWLDFISAREPEAPAEPVPVTVPQEEKPDHIPTLDLEYDLENLSYRAVGDPMVVFAQVVKLLEPGQKYRISIDIWKPKPGDQNTLTF